jgi:hypothetical protein
LCRRLFYSQLPEIDGQLPGGSAGLGKFLNVYDGTYPDIDLFEITPLNGLHGFAILAAFLSVF